MEWNGMNEWMNEWMNETNFTIMDLDNQNSLNKGKVEISKTNKCKS